MLPIKRKPTVPAEDSSKKPKVSKDIISEIDTTVITELKAVHPTAPFLFNYLSRLKRSEVQSLLIRTAFPSAAASTLSHCVYCHNAFLLDSPGGCKIAHFGEWQMEAPGDPDDVKTYSCCGTRFDYRNYDWDGTPQPPEELFEHEYCYEGPHRAHLIETPDGAETRSRWWEEIKKYDLLKSCKEKRCNLRHAVMPERTKKEAEEDYFDTEEDWKELNEEIVEES